MAKLDEKPKRELTNRQKMFCKEYLVDLNGTASAIRAGYSAKTAEVAASRLLSNVKISAAIHAEMGKRAQKTEITAERVIKELACMGLYDPAAVVAQPVTCPADIATLPEHVRRAIVGWSYDSSGNFVLKLADKKSALELIGRHLAMWRDVGSRENPAEMVHRVERVIVRAAQLANSED